MWKLSARDAQTASIVFISIDESDIRVEFFFFRNLSTLIFDRVNSARTLFPTRAYNFSAMVDLGHSGEPFSIIGTERRRNIVDTFGQRNLATLRLPRKRESSLEDEISPKRNIGTTFHRFVRFSPRITNYATAVARSNRGRRRRRREEEGTSLFRRSNKTQAIQGPS